MWYTSFTGSIIVTFTIEGSNGNVTQITSAICGDISSTQTVTVGNNTLTLDSYITVDGVDKSSECSSSDEVQFIAYNV